MRRTIQIVVIAVLVLMGLGMLSLYSMYQKSVATLETSQKAEQATNDQYAQAITSIAEIQDSLDTILPEGQKLPAYNPSYANERAMGGPNSHEIIDRIALIRAGLQRGKERVAKLEADLEHAGSRMAGLKKIVAGLRKTVQEKEQQLAEMGTQLASTQDTLRVHDETLADRQRELATVFVVEGPKRELMKSGVIVAKGGVLGLGKTLKPSASIPEPLLTPLNTDEETVVRLNAKKAQVVSAQPLASYQLLLVDGKVELHIIDPAEFRKVRQLVIVTA